MKYFIDLRIKPRVFTSSTIFFKFFSLAFFILININSITAQLDNPDWGEGIGTCSDGILLYPGVAVATCAVTDDVPVNERYTMAFMSLNAGTTVTMREEITNMDSALHHTDWLIQNIGNLFGVALVQETGTAYVAASSNYGSSYGFVNMTADGVLNYGNLNPGATELENAGTVYRIDPITGAASVFTILPQQATTLAHWDCENNVQELTRNNTGVGLGNISYDDVNDQFFITNVEDGRIYRVNSAGVILDSYDPGVYDTGVPGIADLEDTPYGLAVEPGSGRLFYGLVDDPGAGSPATNPGSPQVFSIDLGVGGTFVGTSNTTVLPAGVPDNFVGTETLQATIPTGGGNSFTNHTVYFISDITFPTADQMLVGVRVGCHASWHTSYNHWAETNLITRNTGTNLFSNTPFEYDISVTGDAGIDDTYGGVAYFDPRNDDCDLYFATSSADILAEAGPHGLAIWNAETMNAPVDPLGVFSYGLVDNLDPKGVGGDLEIFNGCRFSCDISGDGQVCENETFTLNFTPPCSSITFEWQVDGGASINGVNDESSVSITAGSNNFTVTLISRDIDDPCEYPVTVIVPNTTLNDPADVCIDGADMNFSGSPIGGTYSSDAGAALSDNGDGTAVLDVDAAGSGIYTISYSATDAAGCIDEATVMVEVFALPEPSILPAGPFCVAGLVETLQASPVGGTWSGTGITNPVFGLFDPVTAGVGTHTVTYKITDLNNCSNDAMIDIVVNGITAEVTTTPSSICADAENGVNIVDLNDLLSPTGTTGTWADTDASGGLSGSVFTAAEANRGTVYTFTYTITGDGPAGTNCDDKSFEVEVDVLDCRLDAALIKTLDTDLTTTPVQLNQTVTFNVEICNQGPTVIDSLEVSDYIPDGYSFSDNNGWIASGNDAVITLTIGNGLLTAAGLALDACIDLPIELVVISSDPDELINYAEITGVRNTSGAENDIDSTPGSNSADENNVLPGDPDDDNADGGGPDAGEDEDDHDPATVPVVDIALAKSTMQTGPFSYGSIVLYQVEVTNQGNVDLNDIEVTDYIPCGLAFPSSLINNNWTAVGVPAMFAVSDPFDLSVGATTILQLELEVIPIPDGCENSTAYTNYAEVSYMEDPDDMDVSMDDIDSNADATNGNDPGGVPEGNTDDEIEGDGTGIPNDNDPDTADDDVAAEDEDDHDPAFIEVFDLALDKLVDDSTAGPFVYGNVITFAITVYNQGSVDGINVEVSDYIPAGYSYDPSSANNAGVWMGAAIAAGAGGTVTTNVVSLPAGEMITILIDLILEPGMDPSAWDNYAEISEASDPDGNNTTAGTLIDVDSTPGSNGVAENDVDPGDPDDNNIDGQGAMVGEDEDDHDPAAPQIFDLAQNKTIATAGSYDVGQDIEFTITVENQGNVSATEYTIIDYIPSGFTYSGLNNPFEWSYVDGAPTTFQEVTDVLLPGATATFTLYLTLQIPTDMDYADGWINYSEIASAVGPTGNEVDADSTPDTNNTNDTGGQPESPADDYTDGDGLNGGGVVGDDVPETDEDDHDPALVSVHDVALIKTLPDDQETVSVGDLVTFTITVTNQGNHPVTELKLTDYVNEGYNFVDNNNWITAGANACLTANLANGLITAPGLAPGESISFPIDMTISASANIDNVLNVAEITQSTDSAGLTEADDLDSIADSDPDNDEGGVVDSDSDDVIDGDGTGIGGPEDPGTDEDDQDPAAVVLELYSLGNQVWNDANNNGIIDAGEEMIEGVEVVLHYFNPETMMCEIIESVFTDANGLYLFDTLNAGDYIVELPGTNFDMGGPLEDYTSSTGSGPTDLSSGPNEDGENPIDPDDNVNVDDNGVLNGNAMFAAGSIASDTLTLGGVEDEPLAEGDDTTDSDNDMSGALDENSNLTVDFGFVELHSLGNQVWQDDNNNGILDEGEEPIEGLGVVLHYYDPVTMMCVIIESLMTDADGKYLFDSLIAGDYIVELPASNFADGGVADGYVSSTGSGAEDLTNGPNEDEGNPIDPDNDVNVDDNGVLNGNSMFAIGSIASDTLTLGGVDDEPLSEGDDPTDSDNDMSGAADDNSNLTVDFGLVPLHSIGNQVWIDTNNNGVIDADEEPIVGVEVILHYFDPVTMMCLVLESVTTDMDGQYLFDSLIIGDYIIELPASNFDMGGPLEGHASSTGSGVTDLSNGPNEDGTNPIDPDNDINVDDNGVLNGNPMFAAGSVASDTITLTNEMEPLAEGDDPTDSDNDMSGALDENSNLTVDFGFVPLYSMGNQVWNDANNNGVIDDGEEPIAGVEVVLHYYDPATMMCVIVESVTTDTDGQYLFDSLIAGDYIVELPGTNFDMGGPLEDYTSSTGSGPTDLSSGPNEDGENPIDPDDNVNVDDNGVLNGNAMFAAGSIASDTLTLGGVEDEPLAEGDDTTDSDNDMSGALDENSNLTVDFGFVELHSLGNQVWQDDNNNGILDEGEEPIEGLGVVLHYYDPVTMMCVIIESLMTDADGKYLFDSLIAGDYIVELPASNFADGGVADGYVSSTGSGAEDLTNGPNEDEGKPIDPDNDVNVDDNGVLNGNSMFAIGSIASDTLTLGGVDDEPLSEGDDPTDSDNDMSGAADDNSNLTVDFGLVPLHSIGNQVWIDTNNNGVIDADEEPIVGVEVILHYFDPVTMKCLVLESVTTDADGQYLFDSLIIGDYIIELPASNFEPGAAGEGLVSSTGSGPGDLGAGGPYEDPNNPIDPDNDTNLDDNGIMNGNLMFTKGGISSDTITLTNDMEPVAEGDDPSDSDNDMSGALDVNSNLTVDFGLTPIFSLGNTVWVDDNYDGIFDMGDEEGLEGVTVELHLYDPVTMNCILVETTVTDENGLYLFDSLTTGDYIVVIPSTDLEPGGVLDEYHSTTGTFNEGGIYEDQDNPVNADGNVDNDDNGLTIESGMFAGGVVSDTINLCSNKEPLGEDPNNDGSGANDGNSNLTVDFGFAPNVPDLALRKTVVDRGPIAPGEIAEFIITVFNQGNIDAKNIEVKDYLNRGYIFDMALNPDWMQVGDDLATTIEGPLVPTDSTKVFLNLIVQVPAAPVDIPDWYNYAEINSAMDTFDVDLGDIDSEPSSNTAEELSVIPDDENDNEINEGGPNAPSGPEDEDDHDVDYVLVIGWWAGVAWHDIDGDGVQDPSEPIIPGAVVTLFDDMGNEVASTISDDNGEYIFENLIPGDYQVEFVLPEGYEITFQDEGPDDDVDSDVTGVGFTFLAEVMAGDTTYANAGGYFPVPIGDLVWFDNNEDDIWDFTENGINGIKVNIYRQMNGGTDFELWDVDFTGHKPGTPSDDGYYKFNAPPGTYYLEIGSILNGLVAAQENIGNVEEIDSDITNDNGPNTTDQFAVLSGDDVCDMGAGFYLMATAGDFVWRDDNGNGQQENWEPRMEGVTIQAFDVTGDMIAESVTDNQGAYEIDYLQKEDYYFKVVPPLGMSATVANSGNDNNDSDVDHSFGSNTTTTYLMSPGDHVPSIDVGLVFGTVPVEFTEFNGENRKTHNFIFWSTASEINNEKFELERSLDNTRFKKIADIKGAGTFQLESNYSFKDADILESGIYYYRLRQVDYDGNATFSGKIAIRVEKELARAKVSVYPNPGVDDIELYISGLEIAKSVTRIEIFDGAGRIVKMINVNKSENMTSIRQRLNIEDLSEDVYTVRVNSGSVIVENRLIKVLN